MSREINQLTPVPTLDNTALLEIEQTGVSFRTTVNDVLALAHTNLLSALVIDTNKDWLGFDITNLGGITINNPADTFQYIITPDAIVANRILNLPLLLSADTFVTELHAQTLENKTIDFASNTVTTTFAELNAAVSDATLVDLDDAQTLTNKSIDFGSNTITTTFAQLNTAVSDATLVDLVSAQTLTNKTLALGSNTISGTTAEFNAALTDNDFATLAGVEILTNKSIDLANNTITGTTAEFNTALSDGDFATLAGTETLTNKTIDLANNTLQTTFAQLNTAVSDATLVDLDDAQTLTNKTINSVSNTITITKSDISDFPIVTADIADDNVTFAKIQNIATQTFIGRTTAGSGDPEELSAAQATDILNTFTDVLDGLAPASGGGTTNFLRADGTWVSPSGAGEQNTISSDGGGLGLTSTISKVGVDLRVRSLAATSPLNVAEATDLITFTIDLLVNADISATAAIVNSKLADIATATLLGRTTAGSGVREELTGTQATTLLDIFTDALKGLVPLSGGGTVNFLRADGTFAVPPGTGLGDMILAAVQTVTGAKTFADDAFLIQNPAITFAYLFQGGAIVANRTINLPVLIANDTLVFEAHIQTLTNKVIDAANNTITNIGSSEVIPDIITGQTVLAALAFDDELLIHDTSAAALRRVEVQDIIRFEYVASYDNDSPGDLEFFMVSGGDHAGVGVELERQAPVTSSQRLTLMGISVNTNSDATVTNWNLRINGVNGNQTATIPANTTGFFQDVSNTDDVVVGDLINYQVVNINGTVAMTGASMRAVEI